MDAISEARLQEVNPALADKIRMLSTMLTPEGISLMVTQGFRSSAEQAALYAKGRTAPGPVVTNAPPGTSWHEFGVAVDCAPEIIVGQIDWNAAHPQWRRMVTVGESLGLFSGTEFTTMCDTPHFQLTGRFPASPDDEARQIYQQQGALAFWAEVNTV